MELRQLRDFLALAEELHYARAAARLGIDQSPLSRRIKEFEQRLGVLLFARTSRGTQLTPRGESLLPWARAIVDAADHAGELVRASSLPQATLRVALCDDVPSRNLFPLLTRYQQSRPGLTISHAERSCADQSPEIHSELIDVGFGLFPANEPEVAADPLWTQPAYAVFPRDHRLSESVEMAYEQMKDLRIGLIDREASDHTLRARLESLAHSVSDNPDFATAASLKVLLAMVLAGVCIGIVGPAQAEMIQPVDFAILPIVHLRSKFTTYMSYRAKETCGAIKDLLETLRSASKRLRSSPTDKPEEI